MLTIIKTLGRVKGPNAKHYRLRVLAQCSYCGGSVEVDKSHAGRNQSCGCVKSLLISEAGTTHGGAGGGRTGLYKTWLAMKGRCKNPRLKYYFGKGINVCDEWLDDFMAFETWSLANGYAEGLEIDRKKADGDYGPGNCQWITRVENNRKRDYVKLDMEKARAIRGRHANKEKVAILAGEFSVSIPTIYAVISGKIWPEGS